jgi:hypothetical protein
MKGVTGGNLQWHNVHSKFRESRLADADLQIEDKHRQHHDMSAFFCHEGKY